MKMKVKELVERLLEMNQDASIYLHDEENYEFGYIEDVETDQDAVTLFIHMEE